MKKILTLVLTLFMSVHMVYASNDTKKINFYGKNYRLLYSSKNPEFGGYLNEYFKNAETYNSWSEMISVHHFPNAYSPIDQIKQFREFLGSLNCPSALTFDDKNNSAMIDFIMINSHQAPIVLEFNVFKYKKSDKCGSDALQYSRRYIAYTEFQLEAAKRDIEKCRKKVIKRVKKYKVPEIVDKELDLCKFNDSEPEVKDIKSEKAENEKVTEEAAVELSANNEENSNPEKNGQVNEESNDKLNESVLNEDKNGEALQLFDENLEVKNKQLQEPVSQNSNDNKKDIQPSDDKLTVSDAEKSERLPEEDQKIVNEEEKLLPLLDESITQNFIEQYNEVPVKYNSAKNNKNKQVPKHKVKKEKSAEYFIINDKSDLYPKESIKENSKKAKKERVKNANKKLSE